MTASPTHREPCCLRDDAILLLVQTAAAGGVHHLPDGRPVDLNRYRPTSPAGFRALRCPHVAGCRRRANPSRRGGAASPRMPDGVGSPSETWKPVISLSPSFWNPGLAGDDHRAMVESGSRPMARMRAGAASGWRNRREEMTQTESKRGPLGVQRVAGVLHRDQLIGDPRRTCCRGRCAPRRRDRRGSTSPRPPDGPRWESRKTAAEPAECRARPR